MNLHRTLRVGTGAALAVSSLAVVSLASVWSAAPASAGTSCAASGLPSHGTVDINYWEGMTSTNETLMKKLVTQFNNSQTKVHVNDINQSGGYVQTWDDYVTSIGQSNQPNV